MRRPVLPQINIPSSGHTGPAAIAGWQWLPYTDADYLKTLKEAITIINDRINGNQPCDNAFRALPGGRTFAQVWSDNAIWISYDPKNDGHNYGVTNAVNGKEISITQFSLRMGRWTTAATLIHELAHTNGAPGTTHLAEGTLRHCLLRGLEDPSIIGAIGRMVKGVQLG
jgi:hypothetical protein